MNTLIKLTGFVALLAAGCWASEQKTVRDLAVRAMQASSTFGAELTGQGTVTKTQKVKFFRSRIPLEGNPEIIQIGDGTIPPGTVVTVIPGTTEKLQIEIHMRAFVDRDSVTAINANKNSLPEKAR